MKKLFNITILAFALIGFTVFSCTTSSNNSKAAESEKKVVYQCPMDCELGKTYEKPGKCPVCEMEMDKLEK
jgi:Heavy metal binding domain